MSYLKDLNSLKNKELQGLLENLGAKIVRALTYAGAHVLINSLKM